MILQGRILSIHVQLVLNKSETNKDMKIDPYKHKECYLAWKEKVKGGIQNISKKNSSILLKYLEDMECGLNVSMKSKKGARSYPRLNTLRQRLNFMFKKFEERYELYDITLITEQHLHSHFSGMRNGTIKNLRGKQYKSTVDYVKIFKSFWHWHQKINRKTDVKIPDITVDLDTSRDKPKWVYLTEEEVKRLYDAAKPSYKILIMFLFDTGIRAPTELMNIKVSDLLSDGKELNIRDEISKTFGRRIKLMICSDILQDYIKEKELGHDDYLFEISPPSVNQYLKRLAKRVLGDTKTPAGEKYSDLTMYDFRHCSCCYWLPRYKSESALKFRFGWKKSDKIHYYSEMLGMRDTISEEDLLVDVTKTELEQRLAKTEKENELIKEEMEALREQGKNMMELVQRALVGVKNRKELFSLC